MKTDNTLYFGRPADERSADEMAVYDRLDSLEIEYARADHEHADLVFSQCGEYASVDTDDANH